MMPQNDGFVFRRVATNGCEICDPNGVVVAWAVDEVVGGFDRRPSEQRPLRAGGWRWGWTARSSLLLWRAHATALKRI
jgi:hypothetical protein